MEIWCWLIIQWPWITSMLWRQVQEVPNLTALYCSWLAVSFASNASLEQIVALWPWCSSVCRPPGMGVHCDHMVHVSVDLSLWLDSPMFWEPWHQSMSTYSQPSFQFHLEERWGMNVQTRCDRKSFMLHRLVDWPWVAVLSTLCAISAVAELLICCW